MCLRVFQEQNAVLEQISKLVDECLEAESNVFASSEEEEFEKSIENDEFYYEGLVNEGTNRIPDEQKKCIQVSTFTFKYKICHFL